MIDIDTLKEYIKVLEDSSLQTIEISDGTDSLFLEKPSAQNAAPAVISAPAAPAAAAPVSAAKDEDRRSINAPIVGVFYAAPSPESEPYVSVGKKVKKGDVVCIIEAMKCMNEIQAEADGEIVDVLVNDGELVEFDQPLFAIK